MKFEFGYLKQSLCSDLDGQSVKKLSWHGQDFSDRDYSDHCTHDYPNTQFILINLFE